jgi:hypothetical protein
MDKTITPQNTLDVEKTVKHFDYVLMMRTSELVEGFWDSIARDGEEGEFEEILEYLKTNNFEFNLYEEWKNHLERWNEDWDEEEVA